MAALRDTVARMAAGTQGRTEADVQSDVRKFLLDAPLELDGAEVIDVLLEAPAGGGRRIDVEAGCAAIEVKKSLGSKAIFDAAVGQLAGYVKQRTEERQERYVGVLTDGRQWVLYHLDPKGVLIEVSRMELRGGEDGPRLAAWLEVVLATKSTIAPTPREIVRRFGAASPAAQLDLADLRSLYATCRGNPDVELKRELWARLLVSALGTNFEDSDELFITHTYLVLLAELVAHEIMGLPANDPNWDLRALLEGQQFDLAGLHGVVEADFFDWPATAPAGQPIIRGIARRLANFSWNEVKHDVLKVLYESLIDRETRKRLGEYYTPDWLAEKIVDEQFANPLDERFLDPACGSGTFLFWAVRKSVAACDIAGFSNRATLDHVVTHVFGMDLHPVAVTLARVTYLLAISPERIREADRGELTVPVFLGDSVRWEQDDTVLTTDGITVRTSRQLELFDQDLHFPEGVVEQPARFDRLVAALADKAAKRVTKAVPKIGGLMNAHHIDDESDRAAVELVFRKLCRLHDAGRDHLWSYYIRNLARPLSFTRADGHVDVLAGNPPWLAFRHMPDSLQASYRRLATERGLWAGGRVAPHQDLSDLFVARAIEQYLNPGGRFAFVMPFAALSRLQYEGFRTGRWSSIDGADPTCVAFRSAEDFAKVKPALFQMPSCVISGIRATIASPLSAEATSWTGRVTDHHLDWTTARTSLTRRDRSVELANTGQGSPYRPRFRQGAPLVPHLLMKVTKASLGPLGGASGRVRVVSARSRVEKEPWRSLPSVSGSVETQFLLPTHLGASIVAFRARTPQLAVVPWQGHRLLDGNDEELDEHPGLADWWRNAERIWERHRAAATKLSLREQIDYQGKTTTQFPAPAHRVVYTTSGQYLAACRIDDPATLIEQTLYWTSVASPEEGRYLCALFNSGALAEAIAPLQARGQHNPRHFAMSLFSIPVPIYDTTNELHVHLASLAERAEAIASGLNLDGITPFQKARRVTRQALYDDGVAADIDRAATELILRAVSGEDLATAVTTDGTAQTPELIDVLAAAIDELRVGTSTNAPSRRRRSRSKPAEPVAGRGT
jgi:SAM-dependent methyltransferase